MVGELTWPSAEETPNARPSPVPPRRTRPPARAVPPAAARTRAVAWATRGGTANGADHGTAPPSSQISAIGGGMNAAWWMLSALAVLAVAYRYYSAFISAR